MIQLSDYWYEETQTKYSFIYHSRMRDQNLLRYCIWIEKKFNELINFRSVEAKLVLG